MASPHNGEGEKDDAVEQNLVANYSSCELYLIIHNPIVKVKEKYKFKVKICDQIFSTHKIRSDHLTCVSDKVGRNQNTWSAQDTYRIKILQIW